MTNNNQNPREYDAVLGGNNPPPVDGVVLGGIEGLERRFETGNTQQRVDSLADAVKYGDKGIDLLIIALNDEEIEVRAKAFEFLKDNDLEKVQQIVEKGLPLKKGDKLYCVYASDFHYDDEDHNLIDSFEIVEDYYEVNFLPIKSYVHKKEAQAIVESLHQAVLRGHELRNFCSKYDLKISEQVMNQLETLAYYTDNYIYSLDSHQGLANISNLNDFCIENNIPLESRVGQEEEWDFKDRILKHLKDTKNYDKLSLLFDFLQIGKFAFVEEEIVNKSGYLK